MTLSTTPKAYNLVLSVGWALQSDVVSYIEPSTTTAAALVETVVITTANTSNQSFNLATLFPGITNMSALVLQDLTNPGLAHGFGLASGGTHFTMRAGGCMVLTVSGTPPTIYLDNTSVSTAGNIKVSIIGS